MNFDKNTNDYTDITPIMDNSSVMQHAIPSNYYFNKYQEIKDKYDDLRLSYSDLKNENKLNETKHQFELQKIILENDKNTQLGAIQNTQTFEIIKELAPIGKELLAGYFQSKNNTIEPNDTITQLCQYLRTLPQDDLLPFIDMVQIISENNKIKENALSIINFIKPK